MDRTEAAVLFRTYGKKLYNTALRITASVPASEGIMQESLIRYMTKAPHLDSGPAKAAWLRRTCVRISIDWLRKQKKLVPLDWRAEDIPDESGQECDGGSALWGNLGPDAVGKVMSAVESLPSGYRTVLVLRLIEEYDYSEIADMMHIGESSVRSQYLRARKKVAEILRKKL